MRSVLTHTAAVVLGLVIGGVIGSSAASDPDGGASPSAAATVTETVTESPPEAGSGTADASEEEAAPDRTEASRGSADEIPGDGTFVVGEDIEPGTYRTSGPDDAAIPSCYWARLSGTSGELDEIIANGNTEGPTTVTISASDEAFQTSGCEPWKKAG
ncbi:hypothetical protein N4P33_03880 [Streptomyces sp. 15-116A]|uniref:hypothetical protein n=1 Tax=Streptomyces sp. 15-116A TaxID=2259035 RepID=UPI0021B3CC40|nr:hypothetical protein [Streptomyces sp. 15-116A]MCT7351309.1 hypothetical protein [Streptomyces sp. 15-116A]